MNNKYDFLAGITYILFMLFAIIIGICGLLFGQHRIDTSLLAIFLIIAPTIDLTRRFTIAWIYMNMEEENDEDNDEIK
jgi:hypothetical protein